MKSGPYVRLSVTDTGHGIDEKTIARATEPFFTTKGVGKGTGLGLATVYGFVTQSGGGLRLRSVPGQGTTIDLYLPRAGEPGAAAAAEEALPLDSHSRRILVVEDDEAVRSHLVRLLRAMGHSVVEAENGVRALTLLVGDQHIDLLLTDIIMPGGLDGRQLAARARSLRPALKVLFTTGSIEVEAAGEHHSNSQDQVLRKPYRRAALTQAVAHALGLADAPFAAE
jgi:CheY-like chemotaxis protein